MERPTRNHIFGWSGGVCFPLGLFFLGSEMSILGLQSELIGVILLGLASLCGACFVLEFFSLKKRVVWQCSSAFVVVAATSSVATIVYQEPIKNPEDARNKFIRVTRISEPWEGKDEFGILIEFRVREIPTSGHIAEVKFNASNFAHHQVMVGDPNVTTNLLPVVTRPGDRNENVPQLMGGENVLRESLYSCNSTRSQSIYWYIESHDEIWPEDILFFALPSSANKLRSEALQIGRSYGGWKRPVE